MTACVSHVFPGIYRDALNRARLNSRREPVRVHFGPDMHRMWQSYLQHTHDRRRLENPDCDSTDLYHARMELGRDGFLPLVPMQANGIAVVMEG